ncbi:AMP-binding protein [Pseudohongiella nitratireducens]|uniref:AMP-binding protein n=1 Tax=Pseudohongiella nitratireducens TaxID=1768907 RepID=UPI00083AC7E8|nr:AMP-binding protein [Pseudohongiella nitratireducens]
MRYENLAEMFESQCQEIGHKRLYVFYDKRLRIKNTLTAVELLEKSRNTARQIAALSPVKNFNISGRVVFLSFSSVSDFIIAFWAVVISGGIPSPIPVKMAKNVGRLNKALSYSSAVLLIRDTKSPDKNIDTLSVAFSDLCKIQEAVTDNIVSRQKTKDIALLQHSSGSTSEPKPIALSNGNVLHNLDRIARSFSISESDVGASWLPHYHDMGLIGHILVPLFSGIENHFISPVTFSISPISWLTLISKTRATISGAPNFAYQYCYEYIKKNRNKNELELSSWRVAYSGAECISLQTLKHFSSALSGTGFSADNYYPCYGLAESTLMVSCRKGIRTCQLDPKKHKKYVSVGVVCPDEITVTREDGAVCSEREIGQIIIHSPSVTEFSEQSAVNTGDVGFISDCELYVVGRQVNVVKYHGEKVYLEEVELLLDQKLAEHGVKRSIVIQADDTDSQYIVLIESNTKIIISISKEISQIISHVISEYLGDSSYKVVTVARGGVLTTSSGKPDRKQNRQLMIGKAKAEYCRKIQAE